MNTENFVGYDYTTVASNRDRESVYTDSYPSFGWEFESRAAGLAGTYGVNLRFKRNRRLANKTELNRLQRQFESGVEEIEHLERAKELGASAAAYVIGILGTGFMAGSVFAYLGGLIPLCIILAIPGFLGWIVSYLCYTVMRKSKTAKMEPLIDKQYDAIYDICEQASGLLAQ